MKKCSQCQLIKPKTHFSKHRIQKDGLNSECKLCSKNRVIKWAKKNVKKANLNKKRWSLLNPDKTKAATRKWSQNNKDKVNAKCRRFYHKHKNNPLYKISLSLRSRTLIAIKRKCWKKQNKFNAYIGCSLQELKNHIEKQFKPGMSWNNHSLHGWHIDHIVPLCSAKTVKELYKLCHYKNLQPLWAQENHSKGGRYSAK